MIDLGTQPPGHTLASAELDADRIDFLVDSLNIVEMPVVLDVFPRFDDPQQRAAALERGRTGLTADGLMDGGRVHADIEAWLRILEQPRWYISARLVPRPYDEDSAITRICLATTDAGTVLAVRRGAGLLMRGAVGDPAQALLNSLGRGHGCAHPSISAPTDLLAEALDASPADVHSTAQRLTQVGIDERTAQDVASAMSTCSAHAEITSVTVEDGKRIAGAHPVAFFDTRRGRLLATSSTASDGRRWSSLSSGSDALIAWALTELVSRAGR